jgi:hypothetical protein
MNSEKIDKKNSVSRDNGNLDGIEAAVIEKLKEKGILSEIEATFKNRAVEFIKQHCYISNEGKLIIKALNKEFRDAIIGLKIWDIHFGSMKYVMLNKYIVVKIANYGVVYDAINTATAKPSDYVVKKQKNGSMRLQNINRATMEFTME